MFIFPQLALGFQICEMGMMIFNISSAGLCSRRVRESLCVGMKWNVAWQRCYMDGKIIFQFPGFPAFLSFQSGGVVSLTTTLVARSLLLRVHGEWSAGRVVCLRRGMSASSDVGERGPAQGGSALHAPPALRAFDLVLTRSF